MSTLLYSFLKKQSPKLILLRLTQAEIQRSPGTHVALRDLAQVSHSLNREEKEEEEEEEEEVVEEDEEALFSMPEVE